VALVHAYMEPPPMASTTATYTAPVCRAPNSAVITSTLRISSVVLASVRLGPQPQT
jgi:hypothetical protein